MSETAHDQFGSRREVVRQSAVERRLRDLRLEVLDLAGQFGDAADDFVVARIGSALRPRLQHAGFGLAEKLLELLNRLVVEAALRQIELPQLLGNLMLLSPRCFERGDTFVATRPPFLSDLAHGGQSGRVVVAILDGLDLLHEQFEFGLPPRNLGRHQPRRRGEELVTKLCAREVDQIGNPLVPASLPAAFGVISRAILPPQQIPEQGTPVIRRELFLRTLLQFPHPGFVLL